MSIPVLIFLSLAILCEFRSDDTFRYLSNNQCNIYNDKYRSDFLYTEGSWWFWDFHRVKRSRPFKCDFSTCDQRNFEFKSQEKAIWELIPVPVQGNKTNNNNRFLIRNKEYEEYLYAANEWLELFARQRRRVYTWKESKNSKDGSGLGEEYQWELRSPYIEDKSQKENDMSAESYFRLFKRPIPLFTIWNVKYEEALYAPSHWSDRKGFVKPVFTFHQTPDETKFNWLFVCKT